MSGHSHWSGIKHKKGLTDAKKAKFFTKIGRLISVVAKKGGPDPNANPALRLAIEKAREVNMPKANIDRAIEKATGKSGSTEILDEVAYEAFGSGGIALIIKGITDNKNRAAADVRKIVVKNGGRMAEIGSVSWMFEVKSKIQVLPEKEEAKFGPKEIKPKISEEELELTAIEAGADDIKKTENESGNTEFTIYCSSESAQNLRNSLKQKGVETSQPELELIPKQTIEIDENTREKIEKLLDELEDCEDVSEIFANF
ncbi:MAG: YebC/PmpR family DNA-binding transcriptional regulator [bacterium]